MRKEAEELRIEVELHKKLADETGERLKIVEQRLEMTKSVADGHASRAGELEGEVGGTKEALDKARLEIVECVFYPNLSCAETF